MYADTAPEPDQAAHRCHSELELLGSRNGWQRLLREARTCFQNSGDNEHNSGTRAPRAGREASRMSRHPPCHPRAHQDMSSVSAQAAGNPVQRAEMPTTGRFQHHVCSGAQPSTTRTAVLAGNRLVQLEGHHQCSPAPASARRRQSRNSSQECCQCWPALALARRWYSSKMRRSSSTTMLMTPPRKSGRESGFLCRHCSMRRTNGGGHLELTEGR